MSRMLLTVKQTGSPIRCRYRRGRVVRTLLGLRLNRIGRVARLPDTPAVRGMIDSVEHIVSVIRWDPDIAWFAAQIRAMHRDKIMGRVGRGDVLWNRFEQAVDMCLADPLASDRPLTECTNEIAVAAFLANDKTLAGCEIEYEPDLLPDGRRIDFVVDRGEDNLYVEVKTIRPNIADDEKTWQKYLRRKQYHPKTVEYIVTREGMGGRIYGNAYASRGRFLEYTRSFEARLRAAKDIRPGVGVLVFCGNGFAWRLSELEDFVDFYHTGVHRADDAFGPMEKNYMEASGIELARNIDHFAFLKRPIDEPESKLYYPVRGPKAGRR
jgi:large subunit ribosomal protein L30